MGRTNVSLDPTNTRAGPLETFSSSALRDRIRPAPVEATAEALVKNARAVVKIDRAEFNQYHTEMVKLSFVLFDEIEKASDAL